MTRPSIASAPDSVLVVVDIQERLAAAMPADAYPALLRNTRILLETAGRLGVPVLVTEQYPKGLGATVPPVAEALPAAAARFEKTCFSCAGSEEFAAALGATGRTQVVLAGMESHVCVLQTALDLQAHGGMVFVVEDACCSRAAANHWNAMERLRAAGVVVSNTESVAFEWLRDARHEQFRAVSALVR